MRREREIGHREGKAWEEGVSRKRESFWFKKKNGKFGAFYHNIPLNDDGVLRQELHFLRFKAEEKFDSSSSSSSSHPKKKVPDILLLFLSTIIFSNLGPKSPV